MALIRSRQELYDLYITELQSEDTELTDTSEGSLIDVFAGITAQVLSEMTELTVTEYAKTFFDSADGPDITGGPDDLQTLAVDHFGDDFARPEATKAEGTVTFSRATDDAGDVTINAGTVVQTRANANGEKTRFVTLAAVTMTGLTIDADVEAETAGVDGNVQADKIVEIETTLSDPTVTVNNDDVTSGGEDEENDAQYRETIRNKLKSLKGATLSAIEATALTVPGVAMATAIEKLLAVIEYDIGTGEPAVGAEYFRIPYAYVYIADTNGAASSALVAAAQTAVDAVRAAGVKVEVKAAAARSINWTASLVLNGSGPNFAELSSDKTKILESMSQYITDLPIGTDFSRAAANTAILAIWGPDGTDDLTSFTTTTPIGDVDVLETEKCVPGTMSIA